MGPRRASPAREPRVWKKRCCNPSPTGAPGSSARAWKQERRALRLQVGDLQGTWLGGRAASTALRAGATPPRSCASWWTTPVTRRRDMNYRHSYHAGNFADVVKHAVLVLLLQALRRKGHAFLLPRNTPAWALRLASAAARKTGSGAPASAGVGRRNARQAGRLPRAGARHESRYRRHARWYPGSPHRASFPRAGDRAAARIAAGGARAYDNSRAMPKSAC